MNSREKKSKFSEAIADFVEHVRSLNAEEFDEMLSAHEDGDITQLLLRADLEVDYLIHDDTDTTPQCKKEYAAVVDITREEEVHFIVEPKGNIAKIDRRGICVKYSPGRKLKLRSRTRRYTATRPIVNEGYLWAA